MRFEGWNGATLVHTGLHYDFTITNHPVLPLYVSLPIPTGYSTTPGAINGGILFRTR